MGIPSAGRIVTRSLGVGTKLGSADSRALGSSVAKMATASSSAKPMPIHIRGPAPKRQVRPAMPRLHSLRKEAIGIEPVRAWPQGAVVMHRVDRHEDVVTRCDMLAAELQVAYRLADHQRDGRAHAHRGRHNLSRVHKLSYLLRPKRITSGDLLHFVQCSAFDLRMSCKKIERPSQRQRSRFVAGADEGQDVVAYVDVVESVACFGVLGV